MSTEQNFRSDNNKPLSRRDFLKLMGASGAAITTGSLSGCDDLGAIWKRQPVIDVEEWHNGVCRFCGTGCGIEIGTADGEIVDVRGDYESFNDGRLCIKGILNREILYGENRHTHPLVRKNGTLEKTSWEEAMNLVEREFKRQMEKGGPESIAYYGSGQLFIEESYIANKIFKAGLGCNNVEGNPRLCMASAVTGYVSTFGADEPPGCYDDIDHADCFFITGSNTAECHPIVWKMVQDRMEAHPDTDLIVVDPRRTPTAEEADLHLPIHPGTDVSLHMSMMYEFVKNDWVDEEMVEKYLTFRNPGGAVNFEQFREHLKTYRPENAASTCDLTASQIRRAADLFARADATTSLWTMGLNQQSQGTAANRSVSAMHLLTGHIGRPGANPLSLTGQPNAGGGVRDTGALSHALPGGRLISSEKDRHKMEDLWEVPRGSIHPEPGLPTVQLFEAMAEGNVNACLIACTNPGHSMPNLSVAREALENAFTVVMDSYHPTETSKRADVVLPSAMWTEKGGVFSQSERRYHYVPEIVEPPGNARSDFDVFVEFAERMGAGELVPGSNREDVWEEWRKISAESYYNFSGITYERLKNSPGIRWPCPDEDHPGTRWRYVPGKDPLAKEEGRLDFYKRPDGRAVIWLDEQKPSEDPTNEEYPYILNTGRILEHWHTKTVTGEIEDLQEIETNFVEIHPRDARREGISEGDKVQIRSRRGETMFFARLTDKVTPGQVYANFHDAKHLVNQVTSPAVDPHSRQPDLKNAAVNLKPL